MAPNIYELVFCYVVNSGIAVAYYFRLRAGKAPRTDGFQAHMFWTGAWLLSLLGNWVWEQWGLISATIVADAASVLLLGVYFSYEKARDLYGFIAPLILSFFIVWMLTLERIWQPATANPFRQAIIYGPSFLLGMLAVAALAPVLYKHFEGAGKIVGLVLVAGYTLLQFPLFFIFVVKSLEPAPYWLWPTVLGWRAGIFIVYWQLVLTHAGVKIGYQLVERIIYILSLLIPIAATVYAFRK